MALTIYNYLTRRKEEFKPVHEGQVGIYVCGPTIYDHAHVGHAKVYVSFDTIVRYLRYAEYKLEDLPHPNTMRLSAWTDGVDVLFWGHFHTHWECRDGDRLAMIIPAWLETRTAVLVNPDGGWHSVDLELEACATEGRES